MFSWFRRKSLLQGQKPTTCKSNPGMTVKGRVGFANGEASWTEEFNVLQIAEKVLKQRGETVNRYETWLEHRSSGFIIQPLFVELQPLEKGGVSTTTTIEISHPKLTQGGVFEYQHSTGDNTEQSIFNGFDQWVQVDFAVFLEALRPRLKTLTAMEMEFPAKEGVPGRKRRAIFGPVAHLMANPPKIQNPAEEEEHPFCPCCLLTHTFAAFQELFESDKFYGIRFFAARGEDGSPQADARVNGEDWEQGAEALRKYVTTWPQAGYEFRKQYVIIQSDGNL
jgi:hypothetical protein